MIPLLEVHRDELALLCRQSGVCRLDVFGSAANETFDPARSDLDFIARFADTGPGYAYRFLDFAEALETLFGRRVDLLTEGMIKNRIFRREVEATRQCLYEHPHAQAAA